VAGKTGTTQAARDAWFIGFTADYVAGVWMGYDDNTPLSGVTGSGLPAEIWHEVMARVHEGLEPQPLPMAPPVGNGGGLPGTGGRPGGGLGIIDGILRDIFGALQGGTGGR
jgi:membrane peptidoglycan carboxypeptidase